MPSFVVQKPSFQSFFVEVMCRGLRIGTATAFAVKVAEHAPSCLITNRHVVTGRDAQTAECMDKHAALPDCLRVHFASKANLRQTMQREIPLFDDAGKPLWFETTSTKEPADVVAMCIPEASDAEVLPYAIVDFIVYRLQPTDAVHIVGFPFGERTLDAFAVWATGHVATQPSFDHGGRPVFLVDCRTRIGQSGSPVILYDRSRFTSRAAEGRIEVVSGETRLLGVYSGRINRESDLGVVWKAPLVEEVALKAWRSGRCEQAAA